MNRERFKGDEKDLVIPSPFKRKSVEVPGPRVTWQRLWSCKNAGFVCLKEALAMQETGRKWVMCAELRAVT